MNKTLVNAVRRRLGENSIIALRDVATHGADAGFPGFCYYAETRAFYSRHRQAILALIDEMADDMGKTPIELVQGFRCLRDATEQDIAETLYGPPARWDTQVANALAWFALEAVAHSVTQA